MTLQLPDGAYLRRQPDQNDPSSEDRTHSHAIRREAGDCSTRTAGTDLLTGGTTRAGRLIAWTEIELDTPSATNLGGSNSVDRRSTFLLQPHPENSIGTFSAPPETEFRVDDDHDKATPTPNEENHRWLTSCENGHDTSPRISSAPQTGESDSLPRGLGQSTTAEEQIDLLATSAGREFPCHTSSTSIIVSSRMNSPPKIDGDNACIEAEGIAPCESIRIQSRSSSREIPSLHSPTSPELSNQSEKRKSSQKPFNRSSSLLPAAVTLHEPNALRQDIPDSISSAFRLPLNPFDDAVVYQQHSSSHLDGGRIRIPLATERNHTQRLRSSECFDGTEPHVELHPNKDNMMHRGSVTARVMAKERQFTTFQGFSPEWCQNFLSCNDSCGGNERLKIPEQHTITLNDKGFRRKVHSADAIPLSERHLTWWQALLNGHPVHIVNILRGCILHPLVITLMFTALLGSDWRHSDLSYSGGTETRSRTSLSLSKIERMSETRDPNLPAAAIVRELPMSYNAVRKAHPDSVKKEAFCDAQTQLNMSREYLRSINFEGLIGEPGLLPDRQARLALYHVLHGPTFRDVDCKQLKAFENSGIAVQIFISLTIAAIFSEWFITILYTFNPQLKAEAREAYRLAVEKGAQVRYDRKRHRDALGVEVEPSEVESPPFLQPSLVPSITAPPAATCVTSRFNGHNVDTDMSWSRIDVEGMTPDGISSGMRNVGRMSGSMALPISVSQPPHRHNVAQRSVHRSLSLPSDTSEAGACCCHGSSLSKSTVCWPCPNRETKTNNRHLRVRSSTNVKLLGDRRSYRWCSRLTEWCWWKPLIAIQRFFNYSPRKPRSIYFCLSICEGTTFSLSVIQMIFAVAALFIWTVGTGQPGCLDEVTALHICSVGWSFAEYLCCTIILALNLYVHVQSTKVCNWLNRIKRH